MPRPKLLKIRLIYEVAGAPAPLEIDIDPAKTSSIFFDQHAAEEILGGFYEGLVNKRTISKEEAIARFGIRAEAWFAKGQASLPLNKAFLKLAWGADTKIASRKAPAPTDPRSDPGSLPMILIKDKSCMPGGHP